jgi:Sec-independent protein translocase protein TatA
LYVYGVKRETGAPAGRTIPGVNDLLLVLIVVLVIVLIVRGPKTLPQIGRMFGRGVREAREEISKVRQDDEPADDPSKS